MVGTSSYQRRLIEHVCECSTFIYYEKEREREKREYLHKHKWRDISMFKYIYTYVYTCIYEVYARYIHVSMRYIHVTIYEVYTCMVRERVCICISKVLWKWVCERGRERCSRSFVALLCFLLFVCVHPRLGIVPFDSPRYYFLCLSLFLSLS